MAKRWYVVHAYSGYEKQVKRSLEDRIERAGMQEFFGGRVEHLPQRDPLTLEPLPA